MRTPGPRTPEAAELETTLFEIKKVIVGQDRADRARCSSACWPGATACSRACPAWPRRWPSRRWPTVVGGTFARIQFTPDLLPADIVGTRIYRRVERRRSTSSSGPVFVNFVLADEINRAPAKVQSALLEVMAEHQVSIGGETFPVPEPFLVLATQNPIESEGVYPLPEAQRDRFLMKVHASATRRRARRSRSSTAWASDRPEADARS